jgi:hypothetical protein
MFCIYLFQPTAFGALILLAIIFGLVTGPTLLLKWLMARTLTSYRRWSLPIKDRLPTPRYWPIRGQCVMDDFRDKATIRDSRGLQLIDTSISLSFCHFAVTILHCHIYMSCVLWVDVLADRKKLRVLSLNMEHGKQMDSILRQVDKLKPDILLLQEVSESSLLHSHFTPTKCSILCNDTYRWTCVQPIAVV